MKKIIVSLFLMSILTTVAIHVAGCGSDDPVVPPPPPEPTFLNVVVRSSADSSLVVNANVVLFQAETNEAVLRGMTDVFGAVLFDVEPGNYFLNISAQGYQSLPPENITAIPFFVAAEDTTIEGVLLDELDNAGTAGWVQGYVEPAVNNFLILADAQAGQDVYSTVTGPDGFFVLFNLPYGDYDLDALKSGWQMDEAATASISAPAEVDTVSIPVSEYVGSLLTGQITFLAVENSVVDITLLDPETRAVIPGLSVVNDAAGLGYRMESIPDGDYLAWASLKNDGFVIDPDWVFKNPGGLDISFATSVTKELDFSVTGAITMISPTNPADSTFAFMADSQTPIFRWEPYPSAKEYFIEVKDYNGNILWGGLNSNGTVNHGFIGADADSVIYNFDDQPGAFALNPGEIYQWKLWADKGSPGDISFVDELISSTEDLRGIFQVPESPAK